MCRDRASLRARRTSHSVRMRSATLSVLGLAALAGCSLLHRTPPIDEPIKLIAVMPIEREEPSSTSADG